MKKRGTVYLKDHENEVMDFALGKNDHARHVDKTLIEEAIRILSNNDLKYSLSLGRTYLKGEMISEYAHTSDIPEYDSFVEAAQWEFSGFVRDSALRIKKGLLAI